MLQVKIETDNAAFTDSEDSEGEECARILRTIAKQLQEGFTSGVCIDSNGNRVGFWTL
jgi:hypothetical protein